jgi:hypothetical protein
MMSNNYEKDVSIDPEQLDVEWLGQPGLIFKYSKKSAEVQQELSNAKEALELTKATLDKKIRSNPEKYGIEKITETVVSNTIISQEDFKEANQVYQEAQFEVNILRGVMDALNNKKSALENLVKLHGQNYFAGPSVPRDLTKEWEQREKQNEVNSGIANKMKSRRG